VWRLTADVTNGASTTISMRSCSFVATIVSSDTLSEVGAHTGNMSCGVVGGSDISVTAGVTRTLQIFGTDALGCINTENTHSNQWSGLLTIDTDGGRFQLTTANNLQIVTPVGR
jgi:hypothetical protein